MRAFFQCLDAERDRTGWYDNWSIKVYGISQGSAVERNIDSTEIGSLCCVKVQAQRARRNVSMVARDGLSDAGQAYVVADHSLDDGFVEVVSPA